MSVESSQSTGWFRVVFMVKREESLPVSVFKDVISKPAAACGVNGTLGKIKGKNKWCIVTEAEEEAAMRFADFLTTGQAAFGETTLSARPMGRQRIKGFHILEKELDIGGSEGTAKQLHDKEEDNKVQPPGPSAQMPSAPYGQALAASEATNSARTTGTSIPGVSKEENYYGHMPMGGLTFRNRPNSSSTWRTTFVRKKERKAVRPRVVHSAAQKSPDGWISCTQGKATALPRQLKETSTPMSGTCEPMSSTTPTTTPCTSAKATSATDGCGPQPAAPATLGRSRISCEFEQSDD